MIRHAFRTIGRMPGLAAVVILSLGVGIGVNTAVFSWIQTMVLKPIPGVDDSRSFYHVDPKSDTGTYPGMSWAEYRDLKPQLTSIEELVAFRMAPLNVGEAGRTERTYAQLVSGNFFTALNLQPAAGRFLRADEVERPGAEPVVVISHDYWQRNFAGAPSVIGQTIRVNDLPLTIVGVAPEGFQGTILALQFDLWVPATHGAGTVCRIERARFAQPARLLRDGPAARQRFRGAGHVGVHLRHGRARDRLSRDQRTHQRRADPVLARAARAANDVPHRARRAAGRDAAGAARGVRQHRQPGARAGQHAVSRSRRAARARCGARQRDPPDARGEPAARPARRRGRHRDRLVGHRGAARDAALRRVPGEVPDQSRLHRAGLRRGARHRQRPALRRGAGAATRPHRSAAGAAERIEVRRPERRS